MILDPKYIARGWCGGRFDELVLPPGASKAHAKACFERDKLRRNPRLKRFGTSRY
jgi:hypothetical protein